MANKINRGLEETGRLFRYHDLDRITRKNNGIYVTGHHTTDYCESVLLHITRGGGKNAFSTLKPLYKRRFLPLVFLEDKEIEYLYLHIPKYFPIFEDESNKNTRFKRNRIRKEILPLLKEENLNFYTFYWNFHSWESSELKSLPKSHDSITRAKLERSHHIFSDYTWQSLEKNDKKKTLDFYLSLLGFPPLYRSPFDDFLLQSDKERATLETKLFLIFKPFKGDVYLISKKSLFFQYPEITEIDHLIQIKWNGTERFIPNDTSEYHIGCVKEGERIQLSYGKKEIREIMRERKIPYFLRTKIPIIYKKNLPIQILFSMFDPSIQDYPSL